MRKFMIGLIILLAVFTFVGAANAAPPAVQKTPTVGHPAS